MNETSHRPLARSLYFKIQSKSRISATINVTKNRTFHFLQRFFPVGFAPFITTGGRLGWPMTTPGSLPGDGSQLTGTV
jgi:hypothetical protein